MWFEDHTNAMDGMEDYKTTRVELVIALWEDVAIPLAKTMDAN